MEKCKFRFSSLVDFCESRNFRNQEIDIVVIVVVVMVVVVVVIVVVVTRES